jgi:hypothetical protein
MDSDPQYIAHYREKDGACQSLEAHLVGVGDRARAHAGKIGLQAQGKLLGILHDLGKYSTTFQAYIKSAVGLLNQDEDEEFVDATGLKGKIDHLRRGYPISSQRSVVSPAHVSGRGLKLVSQAALRLAARATTATAIGPVPRLTMSSQWIRIS